MFTDPLDIVVDTATIHLARVGVGDRKATYSNADGSYVENISHQNTGKGRIRHLVRLDVKKIVENPINSTSDYDSSSIQVSIDRPAYGFTVGDIDALMAGLKAQLTTAFITKIYGQES